MYMDTVHIDCMVPVHMEWMVYVCCLFGDMSICLRVYFEFLLDKVSPYIWLVWNSEICLPLLPEFRD